MSEPSDTPRPTAQRGSADDEAAHGARVDGDSRAIRDRPTELIDAGGEPDPLDALRAELAMIAQQPVGDRVARFEHANVVLAAALAELDEV